MATWLMAKSDSGLTVTVNCRLIVSCPPLVVPPVSRTVTVIVAVPLALVTGVNVKLPEGLGLV